MRVRKHPELLPCPFCGGPAFMYHEDSRIAKSDWSYVVCCDSPECDTEGQERAGMEEAAAFWNKRAPVFIVVAYAPDGQRGNLAVKLTMKDANAAMMPWMEMADKIDIEQWTIGEELRQDPEPEEF